MKRSSEFMNEFMTKLNDNHFEKDTCKPTMRNDKTNTEFYIFSYNEFLKSKIGKFILSL